MSHPAGPGGAEPRPGGDRRPSLVIIPALNEAECIAQVVTGVLAQLDADVLVVDDGSSDSTAARARHAGAQVVSHPFNLGVGAAIRTAMRYADGRAYRAVVQVDGDGQHDPADAGRLLAQIADGADVAVGSRFGQAYRVSGSRRIVMRLLASVVSRRLGVRITDTTSGYRAFSGRAVRHFSRHYPTDYLSDTVESLLLAADAGLVVVEVPVTMQPRRTGRPSARSLKSLYYLLRLLLILLLHRLRRPLLLAEEAAS